MAEKFIEVEKKTTQDIAPSHKYKNINRNKITQEFYILIHLL